jgi:RNA polymerase sigma-70 factor (ECF subfamily)
VNQIPAGDVEQVVAVIRSRLFRRAQLDQSDLSRLCEEHAPALLGYAVRLTGDREAAEDIVQETLLRAWTHPEALTPERGDPRAWLLTVARNLATDRYRARRARPTEVIAEDLDALTGDDPDEIDLALQSWVISDALARLTPDHRAVLVETFYKGRSVRQAAAVLGVPEGTVKSRTFYALRALKDALAERGVTS